MINNCSNEVLVLHCRTQVVEFGAKFCCKAHEVKTNLVVNHLNKMFATPVLPKFDHD